ncbi:hypothetical protein Bca52824_017747 [Brassica carinata]|uniref:Uncharacterized protein n=1 Tax=Brassica carinata TaxID=52824 RepID=A0A8X7VPM8_BRACI|nr:hypothetical protein Bca52824_017747 [Brassica carinata]
MQFRDDTPCPARLHGYANLVPSRVPGSAGGRGSAEVAYTRRSAAFQSMKRYNNVQLAEETVGYCQAHALEHVRTCNQNTAEIFGDYKYNTYDADKTYEELEQDQVQKLKESQQLQVWKWAHSSKTLSVNVYNNYKVIGIGINWSLTMTL